LLLLLLFLFADMFDVTLGELLVVVTGAGMLLGRKEITLMAHSVGRGLGRMVGTLQGLRMKYEDKSKGSQLYQLHKNVKDGLHDLSTIGADINSLRIGSHSRYMSMATEAPAPAHHLASAMPQWNDVTNESSTSLSNIQHKQVSGGIRGSNNRRAAAAAGRGDVSSPALSTVDYRLAQLILADEELNKLRGPGSKLERTAATGSASGVDLVESAICESIIRAVREAHEAGQPPQAPASASAA
jgi:Sec-independent protein translocase protein TatA